jgi:hypothetical protein
MMKRIIKDVKWGYLLLSTILLFCFLFLFGSLTASFKSEVFVLALKNGIIGWEHINNSGNEFVNSFYWLPLSIFCAIIAQLFLSFYFLKKSNGVEYTNGLAFGIASAIFIYQLEILYSLIGIVVSIIVAYKLKNSIQKENKIKFP